VLVLGCSGHSRCTPSVFSDTLENRVKQDTVVTAVTDVRSLGSGGPSRGSVLLGKYRVETVLGFGAMGVVIKARHLAHAEDVAIKVLRDDVQLDPDNIARFVREARAAFELKSEHVARIRDVGTLDDGKPYMVMELLDGLDLGRILLDQGQLERPRAVDRMLEACDALAEAHALGIVHRDIKPTNLFVTRRADGGELLKVLDFGISKAPPGPQMALTQTSSLLGTPAYMSPEQMRSARDVDPRTDIWALGVVLYEVVEGSQPFAARNFAELCVAVATEPPRPMQRAPELAGVLERCLAKNLEHRFQHVGELAAALAPFATEPAHARHHVVRIHRVLGVKPPRGQDPTPLPRMPQPHAPAAPRDPTPAPKPRVATFAAKSESATTNIVPAANSSPSRPLPATPLPAAPAEPARPANALWLGIVLVVLFAIGIAAGLIVTSG
jgi:eukaryotic-like serine/threonine-protein kinase